MEDNRITSPLSSEISEEDTTTIFPSHDMFNMFQSLNLSGNRIEQSLRNSIGIKTLIEQEANGIGHLTITNCLDVIQDMYTSGQINILEDIMLRRKPVNPPKGDLPLQNEAYRNILENIINEFSKKTSGYQLWANAIRYSLDRIDNKQYD